jgi:hypothetical protein
MSIYAASLHVRNSGKGDDHKKGSKPHKLREQLSSTNLTVENIVKWDEDGLNFLPEDREKQLRVSVCAVSSQTDAASFLQKG